MCYCQIFVSKCAQRSSALLLGRLRRYTAFGYLAAVHCAAAAENSLALDNHNVDTPWWEDSQTASKEPIVNRCFVKVPGPVGLGVELNEEAVRERHKDGGPLEPTSEWGRLWN